MSSYLSAAEQSGILATFSRSFDTWSRSITVYKEATRVEVAPQPTTDNNSFGFGETQQDIIYTYLPPRTGVFMAIIKDNTIGNIEQKTLVPEIMTRIMASPMSMKVKRDAYDFIEDGPTVKIIDNFHQETYVLDGHGSLQTALGSEYYVYPLKRSE